MISKGSRDTEDWSNDPKNSAGINYIFKYKILNYNTISLLFLTIFLIFKKCSLGGDKRLLLKTNDLKL